MPVVTRRLSTSSPRIAAVAIGLMAILVAQSAVAVAAAPASARAMGAAAGLEPSIHWEDAKAHEGDRISFTAGRRVSVGFTPRATDRWRVGGVAPQRLPAGRLDGKQMRAAASTEGRDAPDRVPSGDPVPSTEPSTEPSIEPVPVTPTPDPSVDQPIVDPGSVVPATAAGWTRSSDAEGYAPQARVDPGALRREVFGFLPYWELNSSTLRIQYDKLSTIAFFGVGHGLRRQPLEAQQRRHDHDRLGWLDQLQMTSRHQRRPRQPHPGRPDRAELRLDSTGQARQKALLGSSTARLNLARQIAAAVRDRGADGVNLDFEPIVAGYARAEFTALVRTIRAELNKVAPGYQLTFDTTGFIGNYPIEDATAPGGADAIFIMGYDYRGAEHAARSARSRRSAARATTSRDTVARLHRAGPRLEADPRRAVLRPRLVDVDRPARTRKNICGHEVRHVGRRSSTRARASSSRHARPALRPGRAGRLDRLPPRDTARPTYGCVTAGGSSTTTTRSSLRAKYDLVNSYGLRGAGIWALGYDGTRTELYQAIEDKFITDTVPPKIAGVALSSHADLAERRRPARHGHRVAERHRPRPVGLRRPADHGATARPAIRSGTVDRQDRPGPGTARTPTAAVVRDGVVPASRCGRPTRRTTGPSGGSPSRWTRRRPRWAHRSPRDLARTATAGPTPRPCAGAPQRVHRHRPHPRRGRGEVTFWAFVPGTSGPTTWTGRDAAGKLVPDGKYTYRVTVSIRPATRRTATCRSTSTGRSRSVAGRMARSIRGRASEPAVVPPGAARRPSTVSHLPRQRAGPPDLTDRGAGGGHLPLDLERQERQRRRRPRRARYRVVSRHELDRHDRSRSP